MGLGGSFNFDRLRNTLTNGPPEDPSYHAMDISPVISANDVPLTATTGTTALPPQSSNESSAGSSSSCAEQKNEVTGLGYSLEVTRAMKELVASLDTLPPPGQLAETPDKLSVDLLQHQRYGLEWLTWRERQNPHGGILADENCHAVMLLGKTVMLLALILDDIHKEKFKSSKPGTSKAWSLAPGNNESKTTLVVVPPSLLQQWESEILAKAPSLNYDIYHGPDRAESSRDLENQDVVLSTYQTVTNDMCESPKSSGILNNMKFRRIILDEGHFIRNHKSRTATALSRLNSTYRWIATGTPVHNKPSDMFSLVKFLGFEPFSNRDVWNYWIGLTKIPSKENSDRFLTIGKALILSRTKDGEQKSVKVPDKHCEDVIVRLSESERHIYNQLFEATAGILKKFIKNQEQRRESATIFQPPTVAPLHFSHVLVLLLRLRQIAVLPYLIKQKCESDDATNSDDSGMDSESEQTITNKLNTSAPVFHKKFKSAKIKMLLADLNNLRASARTKRCPMDKVIVVSQWTSLLEVLALHLDDEKFKYDTIAGNVPLAERADIQKEFNKKGRGPQILLLSLTAGGVGLNLTGANHMFFMDVHYNPQLEAQAQSRIHRFGQQKQTYIKRYITGDSMEQRVLALQREKLKLSQGLLTGTNKDGVKLDIVVMKQLFGFK